MSRVWSDFGISLPPHASGEVDVTCPQCSAKRRNRQARCLSVNVALGVWVCFHCEWRGSLAKGEEASPRPVYRAPELPPLTDLPCEVVAWFESRGIPERVLRRNRIATKVSYFPQTEDRRTAIVFPYFRGEVLVNLKYRTREKQFKMHPGAERILYGLADVAERTVIVEGEMDKLAVETAGIEACVSVPDGAPAPKSKGYASKFDYLETDADRLAVVKVWVLAVDNDEPGKALEAELVRRFGAERCSRVEWPEGCKDANDVLIKHGHARLKQCLDDAKPYPVEGIIEPLAIRDLFNGLYERGRTPGVDPGWDSLKPYYTVRPGEWTLVTGIPSHGKSTWLDALLVNLAIQHGWRVALCSPENQPVEDHMANLAEKIVGKPFEGYGRMSESERDMAFWMLQDHFRFILPEEPTVEAVIRRARIEVERRGITGLVVDPWNELIATRSGHLTETEYISQALGQFRKFAREARIHLWLVAHPTKLKPSPSKNRGEDDAAEKEPVPTPYDVSGSSHWRNKADNCITIWRDIRGVSNIVQVHVQKVRFRHVGRPGVVELLYDRSAGTFADLNTGVQMGTDAPSTPPSFYEPEPPEREPEPVSDLSEAERQAAIDWAGQDTPGFVSRTFDGRPV